MARTSLLYCSCQTRNTLSHWKNAWRLFQVQLIILRLKIYRIWKSFLGPCKKINGTGIYCVNIYYKKWVVNLEIIKPHVSI